MIRFSGGVEKSFMLFSEITTQKINNNY